MSISSQFTALVNEQKANIKTINKLLTRNKAIQTVIDTVKRATKPGTKASVADPDILETHVQKKTRAKPTDIQVGIRNDILAIMKDGAIRDVGQIGVGMYLKEPTLAQRKKISNACGGLVRGNKLIRENKGQYRMKFVKGNNKKTTENIGHDTRVTQMGGN